MRARSVCLVIAIASVGFACASGKPDDGYSGYPPDDNYDWDSGPSEFPPSSDAGVFAPFGSPSFGATVSADKAPPPLSGGTLAISKDDALAIAADPDRDAVHLVDLALRAPVTIALNANDEPGRIIEDSARRAHVVLRRGGAVATIDLATKKLLERRAVCAAPRGIAYDARTDVLHVACAGGELVTLPAATGAATRTLQLPRDLRDVLVIGDQLFVSTFRGAELLEVGADGAVKTTRKAPNLATKMPGPMTTHVAWRTVADPLGGMVMLHQRSVVGPISTGSGGYAAGGKCSPGIVQATTTSFSTGTDVKIATAPLFAGVLALDMAFSADGSQVAFVSAGNAKLPTVQQVMVVKRDSLAQPGEGCIFPETSVTAFGEAIAVAWTKSNKVVYQSREPAMIVIDGIKIELSSVSRGDTGHAIFHANSGAGIACASCHPEGGDDAHTWNFDAIGPRRTQTFRGGVLGTEPLHWDGDMKDLNQIMSAVFVGRMAGVPLDSAQINALAKWVDAIPTIPNSPARDAAAVSRGAALFADTTVGCSGCHSGAHLTNNFSFDVGTGRKLQVPSLRGIAWRAPYMHNGCAPTLLDRFGACGGGDMHGMTSHLSDAQRKDLVAYLETL